jgi:hypothetical protein
MSIFVGDVSRFTSTGDRFGENGVERMRAVRSRGNSKGRSRIVFVISAIYGAMRAADGRDRRRLAPPPAALRRLVRGDHQRRRRRWQPPMDRDRATSLSIFFPFDMRDLVDCGRAEEADDRG